MITLFILMLAMFAIATPIAWSMGIASAVYMAFGPHVPLQGLVQRMIGGIDTFPLLAIPFFILAGNLMNTGGITDRLVAFSKALVGHIIGGRRPRHLDRNTIVTAIAPNHPFTVLTRPTPVQQKAFDLLGFPLACTQ